MLDFILIILGLQTIFFTYATIFKTDRVTDLSYGLTFVMVAIYALFKKNSPLTTLLATIMILWGIRIALYLFIRIQKMGRDERFDGRREAFFPFLSFWLLQALTISILSLPIILAQGPTQPFSYFAASLAFFGLTYQTIADWQKFTFRLNPQNAGKFIQKGLWKFSKHPNYFGEILVWSGIYLAALPQLSGTNHIAVLSPAFIIIMLRFVSGIPPLQKIARQKYAQNPAFCHYQKNTNLLIPFKPKKTSS